METGVNMDKAKKYVNIASYIDFSIVLLAITMKVVFVINGYDRDAFISMQNMAILIIRCVLFQLLCAYWLKGKIGFWSGYILSFFMTNIFSWCFICNAYRELKPKTGK